MPSQGIKPSLGDAPCQALRFEHVWTQPYHSKTVNRKTLSLGLRDRSSFWHALRLALTLMFLFTFTLCAMMMPMMLELQLATDPHEIDCALHHAMQRWPKPRMKPCT